MHNLVFRSRSFVFKGKNVFVMKDNASMYRAVAKMNADDAHLMS